MGFVLYYFVACSEILDFVLGDVYSAITCEDQYRLLSNVEIDKQAQPLSLTRSRKKSFPVPGYSVYVL